MNQSFISDILYADIESKAKELTVNSNNTVQPVALMRLGVFVPKPSKSKGESKEIDATKAFSQLEIAKAEGYDDIKITGPRLDMDTDFKTWIGVIYAFSKYGLSSNTIQLSFQEFAKACGFPSKRLDAKLRLTIHESLGRLRNKGIAFKRGKDAKGGYQTGLLKVGRFDADLDLIELEADSKLWELFSLIIAFCCNTTPCVPFRRKKLHKPFTLSSKAFRRTRCRYRSRESVSAWLCSQLLASKTVSLRKR